mgnify:CR=1 FL=1
MLTSITRRPSFASRRAVAQAQVVLPTPPLPVKKRFGFGAVRKAGSAAAGSAAASGVICGLGIRIGVQGSVRPGGELGARRVGPAGFLLAVDGDHGKDRFAFALSLIHN